LLGLLTPYVSSGKANIYQFSTDVEYLPLRDLRKGLLRSTGGTQIDCVMKHMEEHSETLHGTLILTDGYTGAPHPTHIRQLRGNGTKVHLVLPAESPYRDDLAMISSSITVLPPLK
jgi:hypothetical protein